MLLHKTMERISNIKKKGKVISHHKDKQGSGGETKLILNLSIRWWQVINTVSCLVLLRNKPLVPTGKGAKWASELISTWCEHKNPFPYQESNPNHTSHTLSLRWLSYSGSIIMIVDTYFAIQFQLPSWGSWIFRSSCTLTPRASTASLVGRVLSITTMSATLCPVIIVPFLNEPTCLTSSSCYKY